MAVEGGENGGGGGNHPIFAEEDELQVGFAFVETGKDGRDGGRPFFSIIEGKRRDLAGCRAHLHRKPPPMPIGQREGKTSAPLTAASPIACSLRSLEEGEEDGRQSCVCAL